MGILLLACTPVRQEGAAGQGYDLYLLMGQSNMAGRGRVAAADTLTHPRIWVLKQDSTWATARSPLHYDKPSAGVGPGMQFARELAATAPTDTLGLIPAACGGASITSWLPGGYHDQTQSYPFDDAVSRARIASSKGRIRGILWHQGESDSHDGRYQLYRQRLDSVMHLIQEELGLEDVPIVVGQLAPFFVRRVPEAAEINRILHEFAEAHPNVGIVSAEGLTHKGDSTHLSSESAREMGRRYAREMLRLQGSAP